MRKKTVVVRDPHGVHARVATRIARIAQQSESDVSVCDDSRCADARSVLGVLSLGLPSGAAVTLTASGPDEQEVLAHLEEAFADGGGI